MTIIKEGDLQKPKKIKRFECHECGCVWEAERKEYKEESARNESYYSMPCPTCGKTVYASNQIKQ